jgi:hypothetical protein
MASPLKATPPTSTTTHSPTNWQLIRRMLVLAWQFRAGCIKVILLNIALQAMALTGLYSIGLGIDYVKWKVQADGTDPPKWPFGLQPDADAPYMVVLLLVAGAVLVIGYGSRDVDLRGARDRSRSGQPPDRGLAAFEGL